MFMNIEFFIIILSVGTLLWIVTKNKYISALAIPPTYYIISITSDIHPQSLMHLILSIIFQLLIISIIESSRNKPKDLEEQETI